MFEMRLMGVALAVLMVVPSAQAQWKWKDNRGQIHVSDLPPPLEIPEKDVLLRPDLSSAHRAAASAAVAASGAASPVASIASGPRVERSRSEPELEVRRKRAEQERGDKLKADADKLASDRAVNCQRARAQIGTLESGQRLVRVNEKGDREVLDDRSRAQEIQTARDLAAANCQ
jgi:hypothetical protein